MWLCVWVLTLGLSVCWVGNLWLSVCQSEQVMFGMGFVRLYKLCLAWGLSVCLSVQVMFGMGFVCLSVCTSYVWHVICLFVRLYRLCLAWGLSVCSKHS